MVSTSTSSIQNSFKYDVFLSFRGEDTRKNFVDHLYQALTDKGIYTYKDDEKIQKGKRISDDLFQSIQDSKLYIIVFSKNYASSSWCLEELVKIMECHKMPGHTAYPVFQDVEPTEIRKQSGAVGEAFAKHEKEEAGGKWREALKEAAELAGWELKNTFDGHEAKFIKKIVGEISLELRSINFGFDENLVGMETRVKDVVSFLEIGIDEVRMIGIKGMGGAGKTTTARAVFEHLSNDYEAKSFVENVREVSNASMFGLKKLQEQVLSKVLDENVTLDSVTDGKNMMRKRMCCKKVLLILDDVDHIDQLKALAGEPKWFKPGSRILITTRDEQVLVAHRVNVIRDIVLLSEQEAVSLFSRYAFGRENPLQGYEELSRKVVRYAAGLPLTLEVMGSFLCGKDKLEWVDAIERLKRIPLQETLKQLELSYISLEDEYKEIFLDIACILKGKRKINAIRILESCGFHARIGLKVLEQRSLIIIINYNQVLGMHDHIEEMGKNIVRREHPDEPNKHSRLWIDEEINEILANDMGTEETRCLKLDMSRGNSRILMKGLGKMKKLRYLEVNFASYYPYQKISEAEFLDDTSQYFPNSLKYLRCWYYPLLYLPKTFQANNLVGLDMEFSRMVQLWEEGEKKDLKKLNFLSLDRSDLTTFDFSITPNLETLSLGILHELEELCMPVSCQKLKHLDIRGSKLRSFDLGLTPNLETLSLSCVELCMPVSCQKLSSLKISGSKLRTFDLGLTPNLETLYFYGCTQFVKLQVSVARPNLKFLCLSNSKLRSLDLELIPNLEMLYLEECHELVEINAPVGCLKKVFHLDLSRCLRFTDFKFHGISEPKDNCSSATLDLVGVSIDLCPLHPNSNLPKFQFRCTYEGYLSLSVGNIERLISFGLCACTDLKKFSDMIFSLRCLRKLTLKGDIPDFSHDLGQLESPEELCLYSTKIKHLPDIICRLKNLKSLKFNIGDTFMRLPEDLLEKLPENLGQLDSLENLSVCSKKIEYLPDSICMLKRLKSLDVTQCCRLGKLPEDIGRLESLERLVLTATTITHLPDSVCMLKRLKYLNLENCALLEKLPKDLGKLECLEELYLRNGSEKYLRSKKIKYLPDSICMLKRLNSLDVKSCDLGKLPKDIGQLEYLDIGLEGEQLKLYDSNASKLVNWTSVLDPPKNQPLTWYKVSNSRGLASGLKNLKSLKFNIYDTFKRLPEDLLEKLPENLGQLDSLENLSVCSKKIEYLPDSICMLKRLKSLDVTQCFRLGKLPEDICRLESLERLVLTATTITHLPDSVYCCLRKLPKDIGQLECLEELDLSSTSIKHLPDSICMLKHLKYLNLSCCALLEKLPEDLGRLECLETLYVCGEIDVRSTKIEYLPDSICMLKHLKWFYVTNCCLGKLPEDIGQLESLERLDLSLTKIKHLPDSICMLKHLKFLKLRDCALLEKLPEDFGRLECLKELDLTHTGISRLPQSIFGLKDKTELFRRSLCCALKVEDGETAIGIVGANFHKKIHTSRLRMLLEQQMQRQLASYINTKKRIYCVLKSLMFTKMLDSILRSGRIKGSLISYTQLLVSMSRLRFRSVFQALFLVLNVVIYSFGSRFVSCIAVD
ncbi:disease resistance protein (TIR-NBS-LRR class) family [Artemisia annua]|uniref:Disease resistance protein (TIR-NBS-LRR class) family n=1 Tax=Artemisia annua TaxID=35608 RepID=A0A2U1QHX6_ARTAN|nr:disease resistance protein (TIR-NBS-LRR class) family [Artemisia annua]